MTYGNRIKLVRETLNKKPEEFALFGGITRQAVYQLEKSQQKLPQILLEKLAEQNIDINWLITGNGKMFLNQTGIEELETKTAELVDSAPVEPVVYVRRLNVKASAGVGFVNYEEGTTSWVGFPESTIRPYDARQISLLQADGASMEPTIRHGDLLLVTEQDNALVSDRVYIVAVGEELKVKRIVRLANGNRIIWSENESCGREEFTPEQWEDYQIRIIARVFKVIKNV